MIRTEYMVYEMYPQIKPCLPQKLHFIHSEELRQLYPNLEPKCREHAICQKYGAVFIIGIGCQLGDGKKHDGRAPDYDDYTTKWTERPARTKRRPPTCGTMYCNAPSNYHRWESV